MTRRLTVVALLALSLGTARAQEADLALVKSASPDPVAAGAELTTTLTVTNLGPDPALAVTVTDFLPEGSTFVSASPGCGYDPVWRRVECALPFLPPGTPADFTVLLQAGTPPQGPTVGTYLSGETTVASEPALFVLETAQARRSAVAVAGQLFNPRGVATLPDGALVVADLRDPSPLGGGGGPLFDGALVRVERAGGTQSVISSGGLLVNPNGVAVAPDGSIYVADPDAVADQERGRVIRVDPATGDQTLVAELDLLVRPYGVTVEPEGTLLVADGTGRLVRVEPVSGAQTLIADGGDLVGAEGVAVEAGGTAVVAVPWVGIVRVDLSTGGQSLLVAADYFDVVRPMDIAVAPNGDLYVADPYSLELGAILHFDPATGQYLTGFIGGSEPLFVYTHPYGLELVDLVVNVAEVTAETADPDPTNNQGWAGVEVVEGGGPPPPVEIVVDEVLTTLDAMLVLPTLVLVVTESLTVSDGVNVAPLPPVQIAVVENVTVTDSVGVLPAVLIAVSEPVTVTDSVGVLPAVVLAVTEAVTVTDAVTVAPMPPVQIAVVENVTVTDAVGVLPAVLIAVSEPVTVTDSVGVLPAVVLAVAEVVTVTDAVTVAPLAPVQIAVLESVTVTDAVGVLPAVLIAVSEPVTVTDSVGVLPAVVITVSEAIGVTDQVVVLPPILIVVNESMLVADEVVVEADDTEPPRVDWTGSVAAAAGGNTTAAITQLLLLFSEPVADPPGDTDPDDVTNPDNHLLLEDGGDGVFQTVDCAGGVDPADQLVSCPQVVYLSDLRLAAPQLGALPLPSGRYRLHVCGTTSIVDLSGNPLDGDGNGVGGDDLRLDFEVTVDNLLYNPNFDSDLGSWSGTAPAGSVVEHDPADADDAPTSGSARLANLGAAVELDLSQCVTVPDDGWFRVGGRLLVDHLPPAAPSPRLVLEWFGEAGCQGLAVDTWQSALAVPDPGTWPLVERFAHSPVGAISARLTLTLAADPGEDHETRWDSAVLFRDPTVLFADGFEDGTGTAWSSVAP